MRLSILMVFSTLLSLKLLCQPIPPERSYDWSAAQLTRTIPEGEIIDFQQARGKAPSQITDDDLLELLMDQSPGTIRTIYFPEGEYHFYRPIRLPSRLSLRGVSSQQTKLIFDLGGEEHLIRAAGSSTTTVHDLAIEADKGSSSLVVDPSLSLKAGDFVRLIDDDTELVSSSWARGTTGQIVEIESVEGETVYLRDRLRRSFSPALQARLVVLAPVEDIAIEQLSILRKDKTEAQTSNIRLDFANNCRIRCVESSYSNFAHVDIRNSSHIEVSGSYFHHAFDYGNGGKGYGVMLQFSTGNCLIQDNVFEHLRHAMILQAGANGNAFLYNYSRDPIWTEVNLPAHLAGDLVLHGNYPYANLFEGNIVQNLVIDGSHGINGPHNTFFRNRAEGFGVFMHPQPSSDHQNFMGNEITNPEFAYGQFIIFGEGHFQRANRIKDQLVPNTTEEMDCPSLYFSSEPPHQHQAWPPIGWPNKNNEYLTAAASRIQHHSLTACSQASTTATLSPQAVWTDADILLYPNPCSQSVHLKLSQKFRDQLLNLSLYNPEGQLLWHSQHTEKLTVSHHPAGFYLLRFHLKDGDVVSRRVVRIE